MNSRTALIGISIASLIGLAGVVGFMSSSSPVTAPVVQAAPEQTASTELSYPATTAPALVQTVSKKVREDRPADVHITSTTSTSEKPAPLTAEQEATIEAGLKASDEAQEDAREHMPATDYNLPYATTIAPETTTTP